VFAKPRRGATARDPASLAKMKTKNLTIDATGADEMARTRPAPLPRRATWSKRSRPSRLRNWPVRQRSAG